MFYVSGAAEVVLKSPHWNPKGFEQTGILEVIKGARAGDRARTDI